MPGMTIARRIASRSCCCYGTGDRTGLATEWLGRDKSEP